MGRKVPKRASRARERERQYRALRVASLMFAAGLAVAVALVVGLDLWTQREWDARFAPVQAEGQAVRLPLARVGDGQAHFFRYEGSRPIRFFVARDSNGVFRAAFDACDVCFEKRLGYRQDGDRMVCRECGQTFPIGLVNERSGGCNPAPLERTVEGAFLVLRIPDLEAGARYF